jgi:SAM-dependent methyltransferase
MPKETRLLEIGCSRGYLTSYFILAGYNVTGIDISHEAVAAAERDFGKHFLHADAPEVAKNAPYDVVYHVGMIGCVGNPVSLTDGLLRLLRPGGKLLFNAPNVNGCYLRGQPWLDTAPPPDAVTLFHPGFWTRRYSAAADVSEVIEAEPVDRAAMIGLNKLLGRRWHAAPPVPLDQSGGNGKHPAPPSWSRRVGGTVWSLFQRGLFKIGKTTRITKLVPEQPTPFGILVTMVKK